VPRHDQTWCCQRGYRRRRRMATLKNPLSLGIAAMLAAMPFASSSRAGLPSSHVEDYPTGHVRDRRGHAPGALRLTSCTTQLLPSGSLKERNEP
jgi:hypothetical protein